MTNAELAKRIEEDLETLRVATGARDIWYATGGSGRYGRWTVFAGGSNMGGSFGECEKFVLGTTSDEAKVKRLLAAKQAVEDAEATLAKLEEVK